MSAPPARLEMPASRSALGTGVLAAATAIALGVVALTLWLPRSTTWTGFLLLTLACHGPLSPFLPAMFEPVLLWYGQHYPPAAIALVAALASAAAECLNYHLYGALFGCDSLDRVMRSGPARFVRRIFVRQSFLAVWVCAWSPLPDWSGRILASYTRYPMGRYLLAVVAGRIPKFWLLAMIGLRWMPDRRLLQGVIAGSVLLGAAGAARRRLGQIAQR